MNSLFNDFNQGNNPLSNMNNLLSQFYQFRSSFMGNPEAQVKQLLQSGRMSEEQFQQLAQTANQLRQLMR